MFRGKKKHPTISDSTSFEDRVNSGFDHLALFKEINELVSFHKLLEPLSPYSSDSDSNDDVDDEDDDDDHSTKISLFNECTKRVKNRYKNVSNLHHHHNNHKHHHHHHHNNLPKDPSDDKLFQMLARGNRKKIQEQPLNQQNSSSFMMTNLKRDSSVNEDSIKRNGKKKSSIGGARMRKKQKKQQQQQQQEQEQLQSPEENDFPLNPCATSSLNHQHQHQHQHQQDKYQHAVNRGSALVKFKSLHISERGSYFNTLDKGLSKYPNYFDYVDNIKKPFKQIDDMPFGPTSSNNNTLDDNVGSNFNYTINPPSPDLNPDILSALNSCLFSPN